MNIYAFANGNKITWNHKTKSWFYDDGEEYNNKRICPKCKMMPKDGYDGCLGELSGVKNACCGHGKESGYIQFLNGKTIRFEKITIDED